MNQLATSRKWLCRGSFCFDVRRSVLNLGVTEMSDSRVHTCHNMKPHARFMLYSWTEGTLALGWRWQTRTVGHSTLNTLRDLETMIRGTKQGATLS